jgi:DNA-binding CsgD family transcriptional regulator
MMCNREAIEILAYPNPPTSVKRIGALLKEKLSDLFAKRRSSNDCEFAMTDLTSGRRHYLCTRYMLDLQGLQNRQTMVILLERRGSPDTTMQEVCMGWHLTDREREAVGLLTRGMTSKEIAQHMGISPNTVKSFLRLVMSKAGVSTRTGLIGRMAGIVPRSQATLPAIGPNVVMENRSSLRAAIRSA